jgi:hypothetical protein
MNSVRLSGFIVDEIDMRRRALDGAETASVSFRFSQGCGPVTLLAFGAACRHLAKFAPGDAVVIAGRLMVGRHNGKPGIIVDEAHYANESAEDRSLEQFAASKRFQRYAVVKGRWTTRIGEYVK